MMNICTQFFESTGRQFVGYMRNGTNKNTKSTLTLSRLIGILFFCAGLQEVAGSKSTLDFFVSAQSNEKRARGL
ncbi:MAG: hypothetical protein QG591_50 [Planctomycetota bacterium]|jgi:hypothetical protein|nr:hypothetical protein [Planctomycetota bacterium]